MYIYIFFFFFKQKTAYEIVSRDWSSDVCSSDLTNSRCGSAPAIYTDQFRCGSAPAIYTDQFSLRQRPRFLYYPFLFAAAPPLFILTGSAKIGRASCRERV